MRLEFWVLEKGPSYSPEWIRKEPLPHQKRPGVTNILYGDRYASKEEAEANAPDETWTPRFVNWFETYTPE